MRNLIAQEVVFEAKQPFRGFGPLGLEGAASAPSVFDNIISSIIGLITIIAGVWFIFLLIAGAIGVMTAGGDKANMETARKRITNGVIGLVIVVAGIFLVELIGKLLGLDDILLPGEAIIKLGQ